MAEAYEGNTGSFSIPEVMDAFVDFIYNNDNVNYFIHKSNNVNSTVVGWDPNTNGDQGDPIIIGRTNGTAADDLVIHMWCDFRANLSMNLSGGPFNRASATSGTWDTQPDARVGSTGATNTACMMKFAEMIGVNAKTVTQYNFYMFNEFVLANWKQTNGIWRTFTFGHFNKLVDFIGSGFVFCNNEPDAGGGISWAYGMYSPLFVDMHGVGQGGGEILHVSHFRCDKPDTTVRYACGMNVAVYDTGANEVWVGVNGTSGCCGNMYSVSLNPSDGGNKYSGFEADKMRYAPSQFGLTAPIIPLYFYVGNEQDSDEWSLVGNLPNIFGMNIQNYAETSDIDIQGSSYTVYPKSRKTDTIDTLDGIPNSYHYGYVIRKI